MEVDVGRLYSERMGAIVLVFVVRFEGFDVFEGDGLCWIFVDALLDKAVEESFG